MKNLIADLSLRKAARIVGLSMIMMYILAFLVDDLILSNLIVPGDSDALANDIKADGMLFGIAVAGYLIILMLDAAIALGLYVVLKPANKILASLIAVLRLLYIAIMLIILLALAAKLIDTHSYGTMKLIGYAFFTFHLLFLGYLVFKSGYIPRVLGILLMIASFSYVMLFYLDFLVPEEVLMIFAVPTLIGEISLGLWLLVKANKLSKMIPANAFGSAKTDINEIK